MRLFKLAPNKCPKRSRSWFYGLIKWHDTHEMLLSCITIWHVDTWRLRFKCTACGAEVVETDVTNGRLVRLGFDISKLKQATCGFMPWYPEPLVPDVPDEVTIQKGQTPGGTRILSANECKAIFEEACKTDIPQRGAER